MLMPPNEPSDAGKEKDTGAYHVPDHEGGDHPQAEFLGFHCVYSLVAAPTISPLRFDR